MDRASVGPSSFELYGKAVVHRHPYFPFPLYREIPHDTGYEFFLLHRKAGVLRATIIRKWTMPSDDVVSTRTTHGGIEEDVRGVLQYDATSQSATVTITGLKHRFEERVDLSTELLSAPVGN